MTIVIPVTGTAKCGKSTLIKQLSDHFLKDKGIPHTFTIDAASLAKDFMDEFLEDKESFSNKLRYGIDFKTDAYRQSLVDIIRALDRFDLRVNEIVRSILSLVIDHYKGESCVIFINIREIDVIKKIEDTLKDISNNEISFMTLVCKRDGQTDFVNNESDSADFASQAVESNITFTSVDIPHIRGLDNFKGDKTTIADSKKYDNYVIHLADLILKSATEKESPKTSDKK